MNGRALVAMTLLTACATGPTLEPTTPASAAHAPRPFTAEQIRQSWQLGTVHRYRIEQKGKPTVVSETKVVEHTSEGVTLVSTEFNEGGQTLKAPERSTSTWAELMEHATFPAANTTIEDVTIDTPAGSFVAWLYSVQASDGTRSRFFFAKHRPGAPVRFERNVKQEVVFRSELIGQLESPPTKGIEFESAFDLTIYAERIGVMLEMAEQGAENDPQEPEADNHQRIHEALHDGVERVYRLRNNLCRAGVETQTTCERLEPPAWLADAPSAKVSLNELSRRIRWLEDAAAPFIKVGCDVAKSRAPDGMACAVE